MMVFQSWIVGGGGGGSFRTLPVSTTIDFIPKHFHYSPGSLCTPGPPFRQSVLKHNTFDLHPIHLLSITLGGILSVFAIVWRGFKSRNSD